MKFSVDSMPFLGAVSRAASATERKNTLPIFSHVLLEAKDNKLVLTGSSLACMVATVLKDESLYVDEEGSITLPGQELEGIARSSSGGIKFHIKDGKAIINSGKSKYTLPTLPATDFPSPSLPVFDNLIGIDAGKLRAMIRIVEASAPFSPGMLGQSEPCISLSFVDNRLQLNSSNGRQTSYCSTDLFDAPPEPPTSKFDIPLESAKLIKAMDGHLTIKYKVDRMVVVSAPKTSPGDTTETLSCAGLSMQAPDVKKALALAAKGAPPSQFKLNDLLQEVKHVCVMADPKLPKLKLSMAGGKLVLQVVTKAGEADGAVQASGGNLSMPTIYVDPFRFLELLRTMTTEEVTLSYCQNPGFLFIAPVFGKIDTGLKYGHFLSVMSAL